MSVTGEDVTMEKLGGPPHPHQDFGQLRPGRPGRQRLPGPDQAAALLLAQQRPQRPAAFGRFGRGAPLTRIFTSSSPRTAKSSSTCARSSPAWLTAATLWRSRPCTRPTSWSASAGWPGRSVGIIAQSVAPSGRGPGQRCLGQGRPFRAHLRRLQRPPGQPGGCAGLSARGEATSTAASSATGPR